MDERLPDDAGVGRVGLRVADPDRVAAFYGTAVGLERVGGGAAAEHDTSDPSGAADRVALGAGGEPLLSLRAAPDAPPRPADAAGLFHVAYRVPTRAALADALDRLRDSGRRTGASDHLVSEALYARDPEGNGVECYRDRPRGEWERTREPAGHGERGVRIDTLPLDLDDLATAATNGTTADRPAGSGGPPDDGLAPPGTDVGHVHLEVTDLARARAFYVDALGFDVMATTSGALFVAAGGYHHHVGLNTWNGRRAPSSGRGLDWFEVVVPGDAARAAAVERLRVAGHAVDECDGATVVADPDGIEVRLVTGG